MYWLNYLDRNAITLARLNNLEEMLSLSDNGENPDSQYNEPITDTSVCTEYLACVSICFGGYVLGQIPSNMILTRVRPSQYMVGLGTALKRGVMLIVLVVGYHDGTLGYRQRLDSCCG
jgi:hypothetical protein